MSMTRAEHRYDAGDNANQANDDVCCNDRQKHRGTRWNRDPEDNDARVRHNTLRRRRNWRINSGSNESATASAGI
jgi:hypothetical protein